MLKELFLLDPQVVFLNHGSFGACPRPVFEKYQAWQRQLEAQPVQFLGVELDNYLHQARQVLAKYLNSSVTDLVYIPNATHGVNIIARSLKLNPGDDILTTDQEYGACNFIWEFICSKTGACYKQQPIEMPVSSIEEIVDQFWRGVTAKTKLIYLSHITSPTALTMPVKQICHRARQAGILTIIDGAHAPGQINLDLADLQADFYIGNCHKWMLSPKGAGFIVSWGYQSRTTTPRESIFVDLLQWTGTKDPAAALSVPAAIEFMDTYHWDEVKLECQRILRSAIEQISELTGISPLYPVSSDFYLQMGTLQIPHVRDINDLKSRLYNDFNIEIPCIEWKQDHFLRISVQGYNTVQDIDILVNGLRVLLPEMKY
jgi:isopenicillin-N epimerase